MIKGSVIGPKTDVSVTLYNERITSLSDGYKELFYPVMK